MKSGCAHELLTLDLNVMTTASIKSAFAVFHSFWLSVSRCRFLLNRSSLCFIVCHMKIVKQILLLVIQCRCLFVVYLVESKTRSLILFSSNVIQCDTVIVINRNWIRPLFRSLLNIIYSSVMAKKNPKIKWRLTDSFHSSNRKKSKVKWFLYVYVVFLIFKWRCCFVSMIFTAFECWILFEILNEILIKNEQYEQRPT